MADEYYDQEELQPEGRLPAWITETPYWAISAVLHVILLLAIGSYVLSDIEAEKEVQKTVVRREFKPPDYDPTKKRDVKRRDAR